MDDQQTENAGESVEETRVPESPLPAPRLLVVGVGGMGVHTLDLLNESTADFAQAVAVDTDEMVLDHCRAARRIQIGARQTRGHGTGGDSTVGRRAANADFPQLRELFHNRELVIFLTGLGGGVGSGATPALAQTARDEGALVLAVAALPFEFEGVERMKVARSAVDRLKTAAHGLVLVPNQALFGHGEPDHPLEDALRLAAQHLGSAFRWLWSLLGQRNLIHIDWITLRGMLESCDGHCQLVVAEAGGQNRANLLLSRLLKQPVFQEMKEKAAHPNVLIGLQGSPDMTLLEVQEVVDGVMAELPPDAHRWVGAGVDRGMKGKIGAMLLLADRAEAPPDKDEKGGTTAKSRKSEPKSGKKQTEQKELGLSTAPLSKGRFKDVEPTIVQGHDLDFPTFIRRGMKLSR